VSRQVVNLERLNWRSGKTESQWSSEEAQKVIRELQQEGILQKDITLGKDQLYQGTSHIEANLLSDVPVPERLYLEGSVPFQRRFCPLVWMAHLQMSLIEIKEEARKLQRIEQIKKNNDLPFIRT